MEKYFAETINTISEALKNIDGKIFEKLVDECYETLASGHKIIASGLGKNVPICDKFVGTMLSLGLDAGFLHTNSAVHGDIGMVKNGDLVIILTKSGNTSESVYLAELLQERTGVNLWLLSFKKGSVLNKKIGKSLIIQMEHEGDMWNIVPNNSTTLNLMLLQAVAMALAERFRLTLSDFKRNHPGGAIGIELKDL